MSELAELLEQKVKQINKDKARMKRVGQWINGLHGKVISLSSPGGSYYVAFTVDKAAFGTGDYPSVEVSYRGSEENLIKLLRGEEKAATAWKAKQLNIWGSLSEAAFFESLL